jgi:DNA-binding transcriptional LysR family regulator
LKRAATGFDQEAIATLVLSGRYLGFLPDHYADSFVKRRLLRAVHPERFHYTCRFAAVMRRSPQPSRAVHAFVRCLLAAHAHTPATD